MRNHSLSLLITLLISLWIPTVYAEDGSGKARMTNEMTAELQKSLGPQLQAHLTKQGLAEMDAKRVVSELTQNVAACVINATEKRIKDSGKAPEAVFGEMRSIEDLDPYFEQEVDFNQLANTCLLDSMASAGLSPGR